ncbi:MAG: PDZ domain-containing protein [Candidatus Eisenbacteria bacterium]|nr:PDZ domain-containing protein [Candidatus Eisenbacteria bacterium]
MVFSFENLEGLPLIPTMVRGNAGRDTTGVLVLDTGAGFLALDQALAEWAGISDPADQARSEPRADSSHSAGAGIDSIGAQPRANFVSQPRPSIGLAQRPLSRLKLGELEVDQISPVLVIQAQIVRAVTDRPVLGLLGHRPLSDRAVLIDYQRGEIALIPATDLRSAATSGVAASRDRLGSLLGPHAISVPFRLEGDGKIVLSASFGHPGSARSRAAMTLILDTGATKCAFFRGPFERAAPEAAAWRSIRGLAAPTLIGVSDARITLVPQFELSGTSANPTVSDLDVAVIESELETQLSSAIGEPVDGLLGASFLRRFNVLIDYPHAVLWLEPIPDWRNPRPHEYCHPGLQLERREETLQVVGVVEQSPAEQAHIRIGDELLAINGSSAIKLDVSKATRALEGPPGTHVLVLIRHAGAVRNLWLVRKRLL